MNANLKGRMQTWWKSLDHDHKVELTDKVYPNKVIFIEVDDMWNVMNWEEKYEVYRAEEINE